ncbi:MAG TPA: GNAT family N-acetyltransferase [Chloroflexota bacterium]|nr:GNAT family N-acetyltransferase [Chloroflexota bacterium]
MEHELPAAQVDRFRHFFPGAHLELVLDSITTGNTGARLWEIQQEGAPSLFLLWDQGNDVFYLAGESRHQSTLASLTRFVAEQLKPQARTAGVSRFKARALSTLLHDAVPDIFSGTPLHAAPTFFYIHDTARPTSAHPVTLAHCEIVPITPAALEPGALRYSEHVREEIGAMWPSEDRFHEYGFGKLAVRDGEILCWCTAEYLSPARCGIGIATAPQFERRGIATATAARFVEEAQARGITPCWECARDNLPSVRVAEKVGFVREAEEEYWVGFL